MPGWGEKVPIGGGRVRTLAGCRRSRPVPRKSFWRVAAGTHKKTVCLREGKKGKIYPFPSLLSCHVLSNVQFYIKFCCS